MIPSDYIIEVNEANFEQQVLLYSHQIPVLVDFWAEWCAPCRVIEPILEKLAIEADGDFRLAKVNVDQNPKLALRYNVRSIPVVKTFKDGLYTSEFVGAQPETYIRNYINELIPSQSDLLLEKAWSLFGMKRYAEAESAFRQVIDESPNNKNALLGLVKSLLLQGNSEEALQILAEFPPSRELSKAELLLPLAKAINQTNTKDIFLDDPLEATFYNSLHLVRMGNLEAAADGLLEILRQDKHYRNDEVKHVLLGILELMNESDPQTRAYRNELASVLF
jgi:putative thioredoxin